MGESNSTERNYDYTKNVTDLKKLLLANYDRTVLPMKPTTSRLQMALVTVPEMDTAEQVHANTYNFQSLFRLRNFAMLCLPFSR